MEVRRANGIHLPGCDIWLDSLRSRAVGVVTHAHSDHAAWHEETVLTPPTAALMRARRGYRNKVVREIPFHQPYEHERARITLLPAGHVMGSAQVFIECGGGSVLYTGDFKLRDSLTSEAAIAIQADTLIMECTFGLPRYRFPKAADTHTGIVEFCRKSLKEGCIPVLLAYSIGKAQELLALLGRAEFDSVLHSAVFKMAQVYEGFGTKFGTYEEWSGGDVSGKVVIFPPNVRDQLDGIPHLKFACVSGWAMDRGAIYRYRCDAAFPLSDHADYDELLEYVRRVKPKRVFTIHGFVEEFARDLRALGIDALALGGKNQLEFRF